jgi:hypothetical protein
LDGKNKLVHSLSRLRSAIENNELPVKSVWLFPSVKNFHIIIRLNFGAGALDRTTFGHDEKIAYQLYLFSDVFRTCCNLIRMERKHAFPDLIITPTNLKKEFGFYRFHDASCGCDEKHSVEIMEQCPAAKLLRGENRTAILFSKPLEPAEFFTKKFGKIYDYERET